jgi:hypothetical protein
MSDIVDLILNGDLPRPKDKPLNKKGRCSHCTKLGLDGAGHMVRNCPELGRPPAQRRGKK